MRCPITRVKCTSPFPFPLSLLPFFYLPSFFLSSFFFISEEKEEEKVQLTRMRCCLSTSFSLSFPPFSSILLFFQCFPFYTLLIYFILSHSLFQQGKENQRVLTFFLLLPLFSSFNPFSILLYNKRVKKKEEKGVIFFYERKGGG